MDLVVQVGPCRPARISNQRNCFTSLDILAFFNECLLQMGIFRLHAIAVLDCQHLAISMVPTDMGYNSVRRRNDWRVDPRGNIYPLVEFPFTGKG